MFYAGTHPSGTESCDDSMNERTKFSAVSFATYVVIQEMQSIETGQTTITKGDTKGFFIEGKT